MKFLFTVYFILYCCDVFDLGGEVKSRIWAAFAAYFFPHLCTKKGDDKISSPTVRLNFSLIDHNKRLHHVFLDNACPRVPAALA